MTLSHSFHHYAALQVRRLLTWQLPLRRVWLSWCGGLSLGEWVMWSGWLVLHIVALRDITRRRLGNAVKLCK